MGPPRGAPLPLYSRVCPVPRHTSHLTPCLDRGPLPYVVLLRSLYPDGVSGPPWSDPKGSASLSETDRCVVDLVRHLDTSPTHELSFYVPTPLLHTYPRVLGWWDRIVDSPPVSDLPEPPRRARSLGPVPGFRYHLVPPLPRVNVRGRDLVQGVLEVVEALTSRAEPQRPGRQVVLRRRRPSAPDDLTYVGWGQGPGSHGVGRTRESG